MSEQTEQDLVLSGPYGHVRFARIADGTYPAKDGWNTQRAEWQAKFMSLFNKIVSNPELRLFNREQFKQVEGSLYEFKRNDVKSRIFTFRRGRTWYLVSVFTGKKENDLPPVQVSRATRLMEEANALLAQAEKQR